MRACFCRLWRARDGAAAVEFAVLVPFFAILFLGIIEVGRGLVQANAIEKGLRAGAAYAARSALPIETADLDRIRNIVMTGTPDGSGAYLVPGWSEVSAEVNVIEQDGFTTHGVEVPVLRLEATVPFEPLFPGFSPYTFHIAHEQAYLSN